MSSEIRPHNFVRPHFFNLTVLNLSTIVFGKFGESVSRELRQLREWCRNLFGIGVIGVIRG